MPTYLAAVRDTRNQQTSKQAPKRFVVCLCGARFFFWLVKKTSRSFSPRQSRDKHVEKTQGKTKRKRGVVCVLLSVVLQRAVSTITFPLGLGYPAATMASARSRRRGRGRRGRTATTTTAHASTAGAGRHARIRMGTPMEVVAAAAARG